MVRRAEANGVEKAELRSTAIVLGGCCFHWNLFGSTKRELVMPRIRTIKPEFWSDEKLSPMSPMDRLTFLGLISMADDYGRVQYNVKVIDAFVFPATSDTVRESLANLSRIGRVSFGIAANGMAILEIANWSKHQKVDKPQPKLALPAIRTKINPDIKGDQGKRRKKTSIRESVANGSGTNRELVAPHTPTNDPDQRPTTDDHDHIPCDAGTQLELFDEQEPNEKTLDTPQQVCDYWNDAMDQSRDLTPKRKAKIQVRLKDSKWRASWREAIDRVAASDFCRGAGDRGWVANLEWFLGPDIVTKIMEGEYDNREKSTYYMTDAQKKLHNSELAGQDFMASMGALANINGRLQNGSV